MARFRGIAWYGVVAALLASWLTCAASAQSIAGPEPTDTTTDADFVSADLQAQPVSIELPAIESRTLGVPASAEGDAPSATGSNTRMIVATGIVLTLIVGAGGLVRVLSKRVGGLAGAVGPGGPSPSGVLSVLGRYPLSRGTTLVLLQIDRRVVLLSQSAGSKGGGAVVRTLSEFDDPAQVSSLLQKARQDEGASFADRWKTALSQVDNAQGTPGFDPADHGEIEVVDLTRSRAAHASGGGR